MFGNGRVLLSVVTSGPYGSGRDNGFQCDVNGTSSGQARATNDERPDALGLVVIASGDSPSRRADDEFCVGDDASNCVAPVPQPSRPGRCLRRDAIAAIPAPEVRLG